MKAVWKFEIQLGLNEVRMPSEAQILCVAKQANAFVLYALVDPIFLEVERRVQVVPTGAEFDAEGGVYVGLISLLNGVLMFHVFAWPEVEPQ